MPVGRFWSCSPLTWFPFVHISWGCGLLLVLHRKTASMPSLILSRAGDAVTVMGVAGDWEKRKNQRHFQHTPTSSPKMTWHLLTPIQWLAYLQHLLTCIISFKKKKKSHEDLRGENSCWVKNPSFGESIDKRRRGFKSRHSQHSSTSRDHRELWIHHHYLFNSSSSAKHPHVHIISTAPKFCHLTGLQKPTGALNR